MSSHPEKSEIFMGLGERSEINLSWGKVAYNLKIQEKSEKFEIP